jgi:hypothetical protein
MLEGKMKCIVCLIVSLTLLGCQQSPTDESAPVLGKNPLYLIGDFATTGVSNADGSTDIPLLISRLHEMGVKDFFHQVWGDSKNWSDFQEMAIAMNSSGIRLWLYLPSVSPPPVPYKFDYPQWFVECAKIAQANPSVAGIVLDDFFYATRNSPTYYEDAMAAARVVDPRLKLMVVAYFNYSDKAYGGLEPYLGSIDGVVAPYYFPQMNMEKTSTLSADIHNFRTWLNTRTVGDIEIPLVVMIYASPMSFHPDDIPSPEYIKTCLEIATSAEEANGTVTYCVDKSDQAYIDAVAAVYK